MQGARDDAESARAREEGRGGASSRRGRVIVPRSLAPQATIRCFPLAENEGADLTGQKCFYSGEPATHIALFARAF